MLAAPRNDASRRRRDGRDPARRRPVGRRQHTEQRHAEQLDGLGHAEAAAAQHQADREVGQRAQHGGGGRQRADVGGSRHEHAQPQQCEPGRAQRRRRPRQVEHHRPAGRARPITHLGDRLGRRRHVGGQHRASRASAAARRRAPPGSSRPPSVRRPDQRAPGTSSMPSSTSIPPPTGSRSISVAALGDRREDGRERRGAHTSAAAQHADHVRQSSRDPARPVGRSVDRTVDDAPACGRRV